MRMVPVMAHERSFAPLRVVILVSREAVIEKQHNAALHRLRQRAHECLRDQADFRAVAVSKIEPLRGSQQFTCCRTRCKLKPARA